MPSHDDRGTWLLETPASRHPLGRLRQPFDTLYILALAYRISFTGFTFLKN